MRPLVLPYSDDGPSGSCEDLVVSPVPSTISPELVVPVGGVVLGLAPVLWTPVPVATVDKYSDALAREHDVRPYGLSGQDESAVNPVTQAPSMKRSADRDLRRTVSARSCAHLRGGSRVERWRLEFLHELGESLVEAASARSSIVAWGWHRPS